MTDLPKVPVSGNRAGAAALALLAVNIALPLALSAALFALPFGWPYEPAFFAAVTLILLLNLALIRALPQGTPAFLFAAAFNLISTFQFGTLAFVPSLPYWATAVQRSLGV